MIITPENLAVHELIGLRVRVAESLSLPHRNLSGTVVDETKSTLVIRNGWGKGGPEKGLHLPFALPGGEKARLEGARIAFRPFDRPKKVR